MQFKKNIIAGGLCAIIAVAGLFAAGANTVQAENLATASTAGLSLDQLQQMIVKLQEQIAYIIQILSQQKPVCGNNICETAKGETASSCAQDCNINNCIKEGGEISSGQICCAGLERTTVGTGGCTTANNSDGTGVTTCVDGVKYACRKPISICAKEGEYFWSGKECCAGLIKTKRTPSCDSGLNCITAEMYTCAKPTTDCAKEGELIPAPWTTETNTSTAGSLPISKKTCCAGLTAYTNGANENVQNGTCVRNPYTVMNTSYLCVKCGDGICNTATGENICSCPTDCGNKKPTCTDSDNGTNYYVAGKLTEISQYTGWTANSYPDMCVTDVTGANLAEAICEKRSDGYYYGSQKYYNCPNGCKDGACLKDALPVCGNNICENSETAVSCPADCAVYGNQCGVKFGTQITDQQKKACVDSGGSINTYGSNEGTTYYCKCCTDSDGGLNYYKKGILTTVGDGNGTYYDLRSTANANIVKEWSCGSSNNPTPTEFTCPNGCKDGACVADLTCTNECSSASSKQCDGAGFFKTCGNYDADNCLEWSAVTACTNGQICSSGTCVNICGNDVCENYKGETAISCPADCETDATFTPISIATSSTQPTSASPSTLSGTFNIQVAAKNGDVYLPRSGAFTVAALKDNETDLSNNHLGTVYSQPTGAIIVGNSYKIAQDTTVTFSAKATLSTTAAGYYRLQMAIISWSTLDGGGYTNWKPTLPDIWSGQKVYLNGPSGISELIPNAADVPSCTTNTGEVRLTTGTSNYANWFIWNGCAKWKQYNIASSASGLPQPLVLNAYTDSCASCVCKYPNFTVSEYVNGNWTTVANKSSSSARNYYFQPSSGASMVKITASSCFYLKVYQGSKDALSQKFPDMAGL